MPPEILHYSILKCIEYSAILVCKEWHDIHAPNLLNDERVLKAIDKDKCIYACINGN